MNHLLLKVLVCFQMVLLIGLTVSAAESLEADTMFSKAQTELYLEKYTVARFYAINASILYLQADNFDGVKKSKNLIASIDSTISSINEMGDAELELAKRYNREKDYPNCNKHGRKAIQIYEKSENSKKMNEANDLVKKCAEATGLDFQARYDRADFTMKSAYALVASGECSKAWENVNEAKDLCDDLIVCPSLNPEDQYRCKPFENCQSMERLLEYVKKNCLKSSADEALASMSQANTYFKEYDYANAVRSAIYARSIYSQTADKVGMDKADALINKITGNILIDECFGPECNTAGSAIFFWIDQCINVKGDYHCAYWFANQSKYVYEALGNKIGVKRSEDLMRQYEYRIKYKQDMPQDMKNDIDTPKATTSTSFDPKTFDTESSWMPDLVTLMMVIVGGGTIALLLYDNYRKSHGQI